VQAGDAVVVSYRPTAAPTIAEEFRAEMGISPADSPA
jgi:hypothetical protein